MFKVLTVTSFLVEHVLTKSIAEGAFLELAMSTGYVDHWINSGFRTRERLCAQWRLTRMAKQWLSC